MHHAASVLLKPAAGAFAGLTLSSAFQPVFSLTHGRLVGHEALLRATAGQAGEKATEARERAEESLQALRNRLEGLEEVVKGRARQVDGYVRDNPWQALAVAGGVALLVGILMGRSK